MGSRHVSGFGGFLSRFRPPDPAGFLADDFRLCLRFIGTGDAFGSGGRLQTCFCVESAGASFLIDCGASSMPGLRAQGVDPDRLDAVVLTHFHGDHCAGVPFLLTHALVVSRRTRPLVIAGPQGTEAHILALWEMLFPGMASRPRPFDLRFVEVTHRCPVEFAGILLTAWPAVHAPATRPMIVRCTHVGRTITYTGDTGWTDDLIDAADGADILIAECYLDGTRNDSHLGLPDLQRLRARVRCRRIVLTHASDEVLQRSRLRGECLAHDGLMLGV